MAEASARSDSSNEERPQGELSSEKKKGGLHYAWAEDMAKRERELAELGVETTPKRVEGDTSPVPAVKRTESGSVWNQGGTWEDKDCSEWAQRSMKQRLKAFTKDVDFEGIPSTLHVSKVSKCSGTASLVFVRGKVRPGYELDVEASWEIRSKDDSVSDSLAHGTFRIPELADFNDGDVEMDVSVREGSKAARRLVEGIRSDLEHLLANWVDDLRQQ